MPNDRLREPPAERFDTASIFLDLREQAAAIRAEAAPARQGHRQKTLYKHNARTVALFVLEPGGGLDEHATSGTATIHAIEGELIVRVGADTRRLSAGQLVILAPTTRHAVHAAADAPAVFLLDVSLGA